MTQLLHSFNPLDYDPSQGGGSWPLGKHPVIIESAEVKATGDNESGMLIFNLKIIDGPNTGFTGVYRLNLYNKSSKAAEIAHRQLSAVCHAVQVFQLGQNGNDVSPLFGKPFVVECGYQKGEEPGPNNPDAKGYTEIKRVFDINGNEPGKANQQQAPAGFGNQQQAAQQPQQQAQQGAQAWGQGQGQPAQQNAPQGQSGAGWGNNQQAAPNSAPQGGQPAQQGGWGQNQGNPPQNPPQGNQGQGWAQNQGGGSNGPAWGQR